uniref:Cell cycle checkpoint protein RAD1 n=1 Tax=Strigamia maritima TaxID=126957 RepID=T1JFA1_STRMM
MSENNINNSLSPDSKYVFFAAMHNSRSLYQLLRALHFKDSAIVTVSQYGLKVTVESSRCVQASAFIQKELFEEYSLKDESITFSINFTILLECLNIFGNAGDHLSSLRICYDGYGTPLILLLQENDVLTDCKIDTLEAENVVDFDFSSAHTVNKVVIKAEFLKEAFNELDGTSDYLKIVMSPNKPILKFSTYGTAGDIHVRIEYPNDMDDLTSNECTQTKAIKYKTSLLKPSLKPLLISQKVSIRTDERDILCLQYLVKMEDGQITFIEYYCSPSVDDEDIENSRLTVSSGFS